MKTIEELNVNQCPELMGRICNIQQMEIKASINRTPFELLEVMTGEELYNMQNQLIPLYNKAIQDNK